jgi:hypothetical protein
MVIQSIITSLSAIPQDRLINCEFVIITHYLPNTNYVFENDLVFKKVGERLKPVATYMSGRCKVVKINNTPKSLTWLKANRKPKIEVFAKNIEVLPF